ncbi:hypothetical protein BBO99_00004471 [Phytophthora kernoviae]|uniref:Uncharacterized protein n=1 Tax=Phytophthora kernoviae TaxID=325452 RepID=A0A3R7IHE2_9STRA|nr:hypothetical protein JM16_004226 [Phytophthora kernoviae]KAG2527541.1 hypothetical protein JM18_003748 [Phytophthora kernoviae]RLN14075.1 hypothetical protein BBI17_004586 [Phytophthora kernoviae]RLN80445.1 hypothetical protein BBO99_00004471 [Phytophthora kernoviae]
MSSDGVFMLTEAFTESEAGSTEPDDEQQTIVIVEDLDSPPKPLPEAQRSALQATLGVASSAANFVLFPYIVAVDEEEVQEQQKEESGVVSQLLCLPVRLVHSGVSTAVAIPTRVVSYSGRKISGAVSTSHALATSAVVASTGAVARTGMHVARGITHGAVSTVSFTASTISGAVGASARTVSYVIPPSVSNAVWKGMDVTGNVSVNVLSHAIAVPSYRMLCVLAPAAERCFSEEDCVGETRAAVKMLVKLLGPQNAFYLLKYIYETVNSEEAYDAFLLCRDILHESLDGQNYRRAGASVGAATGITKVVHVMKEAYSVLPSFDELLDAAALVVDVSDEVVDGVTHAVVSAAEDSELEEEEQNSARFEYVDEDEEPVEDRPVGRVFTAEAFESSSLSDDEMNPILESGISLLTRVCDSEEASSLFNTFGDFLDVLVD